jgi:MYXO-CTERM domain-containing protein
MRARFKAITGALALVAVAAHAGEQGRGNDNGPWLVATHGAAVAPPAVAIPIAQREPQPLRGASVDVRSVEPVLRLARAEDSLPTRYPAAGRRASPAEDSPRDPDSEKWAMLLAGVLGAAAIARRRLSS